MDITNFDNFRAGKFPGSVDIKKLGYHSEVGVMAIAPIFSARPSTIKNNSFVQFRKHNKENYVAILSFNHEVELDEYWQDSTVIWDSRNQ